MNHSTVLVIVSLLVTPIVLGGCNFNKSPQESTPNTVLQPESSLVDQGLAAYHDGDFSTANELFDRAIIEDPEDTKALLNKGVLLADSGELTLAIRYFDAALSLEPENTTVLYNKATVLSDISFHEKIAGTPGFILYGRQALLLFDKVIEADPTFTDAYIFKGITHYDIGNYASAQTYLLEALTIEPGSINALYYLGKNATAQGDKQTALEYFNAILEIDPTHLQTKQEINILQESM